MWRADGPGGIDDDISAASRDVSNRPISTFELIYTEVVSNKLSGAGANRWGEFVTAVVRVVNRNEWLWRLRYKE
jgi:hypothetical protein